MLRCRDGVTDLSGKFSHGSGNRLLLAHERREFAARYGRMSSHDLWAHALRESGPAAAFLWREAGVKHAVEGRVFEARQMLDTALGIMNGAAELETRRRLHAIFMKAARKPKGGSRALANELVELAAEIIEPVDLEASFRLRAGVIAKHREMQRFDYAAYHSIHMAAVLKRGDPEAAEEHMSAAIIDLREAAKMSARFNKKPDANLEAELGKAMHTLARLMEKRGSPDAAAAYEEAGDHLRAGEDSTEVKADIVNWAHDCYLKAKELGGDAARLDGKIAAYKSDVIWY
jgi:tetratricopeptide (TPR) repeat protein